jgi:hypothetical protein
MQDRGTLAVLDACSLYPVVLRETLLRTAAAGLYRPIWSGRVIHEVLRHQTAHGRLTAGQAASLQDRLARDFPDAWVLPDEELIARMTNHHRDRHVLAAAVMAGATVVVTPNLKDFPPPALQPYGIQALHPAAFLTGLYQADPTGIRRELEQLAASWEPPVPLATLLDWLQTTAPRFARTVRKG